MRTRTLVPAGLLAAFALTVAACSDRDGSRSDPAGPVTVTAEAPPVRACSTRDAHRAARAYFQARTDSRTAAELLGLLATACADGDDALVQTYGWQLLALVEGALAGGVAGDASTGASLVNAIVDCLENACTADTTNDLQVTAALSEGGLFGVRNGDLIPVLARAPLAFIDFDANQNRALFGLETDLPWSTVTGTPYVLFYGASVSGVLDLQDVGFGGLQFDMNRYPVPPAGTPGNPFVGDALHVGVCFESEVTLPHAGGDESRPTMAPLMQREAVLLEAFAPDFCAGAFPALQSASIGAPALALARGLLPSSWFAVAVTDRKAPSLGGTPLEFSTFAPVAAEVEGQLEFLTVPASRTTEGESLGEIRVQARSGGGTPIEKVLVTLSISTNEGAPAGAVLAGDVASFTDEDEGVAVFPDDGAPLTIGKPGGYLLCANATLGGFTFPEVCTARFHIGNASGG